MKINNSWYCKRVWSKLFKPYEYSNPHQIIYYVCKKRLTTIKCACLTCHAFSHIYRPSYPGNQPHYAFKTVRFSVDEFNFVKIALNLKSPNFCIYFISKLICKCLTKVKMSMLFNLTIWFSCKSVFLGIEKFFWHYCSHCRMSIRIKVHC